MNAQGQTVEAPAERDTGLSLPETREQLLAEAGPERRDIYAFVRQLLDDFEAAASWDLLYTPTQSDAELFALEDRLLRVVHGVPGSIDELFARLLADCDEATRESLEDAEFYLRGIHDMVAADWRRLENKLNELRPAGQQATLTPGMRTELCEVAADIKGKYTSSLIGATAAVIAEGRWDVVHAEPLIFPEKAAEHARNQRLLEDLQALVETVHRIGDEIPFAQLLERWQTGSPADWYALAELTFLRGRISRMLSLANRRALYSGDYHQIRTREHELSSRIERLETLHRATWGEKAPEPIELRRLTLELAAAIDVNLFGGLVGEKYVKDLRTLGTTVGKGHDDEAIAAAASRLDLPEELTGAVQLFAKEDLKTFFEVLLSAVGRRASLRTSPSEIEPQAIESLVEVDSPPELKLVEDAIVAEPEEAAEPVAVVSVGEAMNNLQETLRTLRSNENPAVRSLQMLRRILDRQYDVPRAMLNQAGPYVDQLERSLIPHLEQCEAHELLPPSLSIYLQRQCVELRQALAGSGQQALIRDLFQKVENVLDSASVAVEDYMIKHLY